MTDLVILEHAAPVATVALNRPERRNALSTPLLAELVDALDVLDADAAVRAIVVRGEGSSFGAGADIGELGEATGATFMSGRRARLWAAVQRRETPTVAAVHGYALGAGCELALACDIVVAAESARFGLPETGLGIIPGAGGTQRLVRAIGKAKALDVILAGRRLTGAEAEAAGLAARCVPDDELLETALGIAREIATRAPLAQLLAREAVLRAGDVPLDAGLELERRSFAVARSSEDAAEGLAAFREKRTPEFHGR
jgi:enoyl-CoA hydratase